MSDIRIFIGVCWSKVLVFEGIECKSRRETYYLWFKKKKDKNSGENNFKSIKNTINIPECALPDFSHFEMNSNKEVIIEGSRGILQYDENIIRVNMGKMIAAFFGRNLSLKCLDSDSLVIVGFITSIEFIT